MTALRFAGGSSLVRSSASAASRAATSRVYSGGRSDRTVYSSPPIITLTACFLVLTGPLRRHPERFPPHPHPHPPPPRRRRPPSALRRCRRLPAPALRETS